MAEKTGKKAKAKQAKLTGRYWICPQSNTKHGLFAKQVSRSEKNVLYAFCVCGFRMFAAKGDPLPKMTRDAALKVGAMIPDEMMTS